MSTWRHLFYGVKPNGCRICGHRRAQMRDGLQRFDVLDEFLETKCQAALEPASGMDDNGRIGLKEASKRHDGFMGGLHIVGIGCCPSGRPPRQANVPRQLSRTDQHLNMFRCAETRRS